MLNTSHLVKLPVVIFVLIMIMFPQPGAGNEDSRVATMAALAIDHTFAINDYFWTLDWATSPTQGNIYSNKPPGPAIAGAPVYWLIDRLMLVKSDQSFDRSLQRYQDRSSYAHVISLVVQVIPFAVLILLIGQWLMRQQLPPAAIHFGVVAILFGSTASLFMNSYFGHGLAAFFVLAAILSLLKRRHTLSGFLFGWACLCDYGAVILIIPFLVAVILQERKSSLSALKEVVVGGIIPAAMSIAYHWNIFGHPFALASRFSNPIFIDTARSTHTLWGIFSPLANLNIIRELLIGTQRGLAVTQPWVLIAALASVFVVGKKYAKEKRLLPLIVFSLSGLILLILANSAFNGWHGGLTAGPRYLSVILPVFGLLAALIYPTLPKIGKIALWLGLSVSALLFALVYATTTLTPNMPLWSFYWGTIRGATTIEPLLQALFLVTAVSLVMLLPVMHKFWRRG